MRRSRLFLGALAVATVVPGTAFARVGNGGHDGPPTLSAPIAEGLAGPLQLAVGEEGAVYIAQSFAGVLTRVGRRGQQDIATNPGGEIAGVDVDDGAVFYATTNADPDTGEPIAAGLNRIRRGSSSVVADLLAYERSQNPDQHTTYGFQSIPTECAANWPAELGPTSYTGIVESHPYAVAVDDHLRYVADAAANAILEVGRNGHIRTVAVLPPQPSMISAEAAAANGLPACVAGLTYNFEAVPTDVEIGHDGMLYVTTLPGGPEDPSFGARGAVYRVNPRTGAVRQLANGLAGATNLALGRHGDIFVTELFGGRVSRIVNGLPVTVIELPTPAALEYADGKLYVAFNVFDSGTVATIEFHRN
jgi:hypothetical protein